VAELNREEMLEDRKCRKADFARSSPLTSDLAAPTASD
jgi:hypothetical protein